MSVNQNLSKLEAALSGRALDTVYSLLRVMHAADALRLPRAKEALLLSTDARIRGLLKPAHALAECLGVRLPPLAKMRRIEAMAEVTALVLEATRLGRRAQGRPMAAPTCGETVFAFLVEALEQALDTRSADRPGQIDTRLAERHDALAGLDVEVIDTAYELLAVMHAADIVRMTPEEEGMLESVEAETRKLTKRGDALAERAGLPPPAPYHAGQSLHSMAELLAIAIESRRRWRLAWFGQRSVKTLDRSPFVAFIDALEVRLDSRGAPTRRGRSQPIRTTTPDVAAEQLQH